MNTTSLPTSIPDYLEHLRRSLTGADPAMIQDALYDAEEYLRSELAENPGKSEAEVIAAVASSYGAPDEVADIYRDTEVKVQQALRPPSPQPRANITKPSWLRSVFGVFTDPYTYGALFYMLLSLATGIFYFTWTVTGISLSFGLMVLIIGLPLLLLFIGATRILSLVEGRIVEVMLGERMPRRTVYHDRAMPLLDRIKEMLLDPRTWSTFLYFLLMLPLGIVYFTIAMTGMTTALALMASPLADWFGDFNGYHVWIGDVLLSDSVSAMWLWPLVVLFGAILLVLTLHVVRLIGRVHGRIAKHLLVQVD
ncbi:sensor domain-containing protein [Solilutibacter silvestris]|uniref:Putative sensor n=1 Tax=Solilutibacter silvestris TaxID=1645665 RepID=A0A2K1Q3Q5_9GAMM|nr:sensor domain-containing protein [Lysobacter silvestris]PNS09643.1 putative sensor [Lysobacter silvestris]